MKNQPLSICNLDVQPGERVVLALPTPEIYGCAPLHIPIHVIHGRKKGPCLFLCSTFYGDEVNGIDLIHRFLGLSLLKTLHGTLIAIPVMNVYGFISKTRLLPDEHDLALSFPGSDKGNFSSRLAHLISSNILAHVTHCVMIRSGPPHIYKLPQIYYLEEENSSIDQLALAFEAPVVRPSKRESLFALARSHSNVLIFEGGEAHRSYDSIDRIGLRGIVKVMRDLRMIRLRAKQKEKQYPRIVRRSIWVRSLGSGLIHLKKKIGQFVKEGEVLAMLTDPFGTGQERTIISPNSGIVLAINTHPLAYEGQKIMEIGIIEAETGQAPLLEVPSLESELDHFA